MSSQISYSSKGVCGTKKTCCSTPTPCKPVCPPKDCKPCRIPCVPPTPVTPPVTEPTYFKNCKCCESCTDPCNPCYRPYIVRCYDELGCETVNICVCPDQCMLRDDVYKSMFCLLKANIEFNRVDLLLEEVVDAGTYDALLAVAQQIAAKLTDSRIVITLPDGTVVLDTSAGNNTYANYQAKLIRENHNSRIAILDAQNNRCGVGYEHKLSSTQWTYQKYVAIRLGEYLNSAGTIRISVPDPVV